MAPASTRHGTMILILRRCRGYAAELVVSLSRLMAPYAAVTGGRRHVAQQGQYCHSHDPSYHCSRLRNVPVYPYSFHQFLLDKIPLYLIAIHTASSYARPALLPCRELSVTCSRTCQFLLQHCHRSPCSTSVPPRVPAFFPFLFTTHRLQLPIPRNVQGRAVAIHAYLVNHACIDQMHAGISRPSCTHG
jgi:hypothetical protein